MTSSSVRWNNRTFIVQNFSNHFLLIRAADGGTVTALGQLLFARQLPFFTEVIVAETEICVQLNDLFPGVSHNWWTELAAYESPPPRTYQLPVHFTTHADWSAVTATTGLARTSVIERLMAAELHVGMFGFLPGFVYLNGLPAALHVPRKTTPAKYISAGSLAIGGKYLGVYALDSPGGWHVIGSIPVSLLRLPDLPPVVLNLRDRVVLQAITEEEFQQYQPADFLGQFE